MATIKSIEQKAKRYDEAIERAKDFMSGEVHYTLKKGENIMCWIFPELKESEGEQHCKWILEYLYDGLRKSDEQFKDHFKAAIAWLEKQGEKKSVPDWAPKFLDELRSKKNYFDWDEHKDIEGGILAIIKWMNPNYFDEKQGGQKPAEWSEEDEKTIVKMRDFFIKVLGDKPDFTEDKRYEEFIEFIDNRLKSLRPHSSYHEGFKKGFAKAKEMHYDHWKPSEEQMSALDAVIDEYDGYPEFDSLVSLKNDLKKLKGE